MYEQDRDTVRSLEPSGFIFHESRVGSTLLANILASSEPNLVYSEPHLPFLALRQCHGYDTHHTQPSPCLVCHTHRQVLCCMLSIASRPPLWLMRSLVCVQV